jgi:hypothetical protein
MREYVVGSAVLVMLGTFAGAVQPGADQPATTVGGSVTVEGEIPTPKEWRLDEVMQRATGENIYRDETWLVGKNRGLAHCVVTLKAKDPARRTEPKPVANAVLDKVGVRYVPRVLVVTPRTEVLLRNKESPCRGFRISGNARHEHDWNFLIAEGKEYRVQFRAVDTCPVTCHYRHFAKGYIKVVDTPYFAVTNAEGQFTIRGVPPGEYEVTVWHEAVGKLNSDAGPTEVMVSGKNDPKLSFRLKAPAKIQE